MKEGDFTEKDTQIASSFGELAAIALRNARNMEKRMQAEASLVASERRYHSLYDAMREGVCLHKIIYDAAGKATDYEILDFNKAFEEITGITKKTAQGKPASRLYGTGSPPYIDQYNAVASSGVPVVFEAYFEPMGKYFNISVFSPAKDHFATVFTDITAHKLADLKLAAEREQLSVTLRSIGDGVITTDNDGRVVLINKVTETLTGWLQEEAVGKPIDEVFHIINEHTRERCESPVALVLKAGTVIGLANHTILVARDGTERIIADSGAPIRDIEGRIIGVVLVFRDITERIKIEADLLHAQKMEAIGTLVGGIAHEFNNVLGIIIGNTELAIDEVPDWNPVYQNLDEIKIASLRAKDVVKQLLNFSRKGDTTRKPIDIRLIVKESIKLLRASIPTTVEIRSEIPDKVSNILADPTQIHQIMFNLCTNSAHAMSKEGGMLEIKIAEVTIDHVQAQKQPNLRAGSFVKLSVNDTGHGIDPKFMDRIFDPYFTTKEVGKGTGMGLAVVHGIVTHYEGTILVNSKLSKGTTFDVFFPSTEQIGTDEKTDKDKLPVGNENILFIDDEIALVKLGKQILEPLGYQVTTEISAPKALELIRSDPDHYDLVITDMTMPLMTGGRLSEEILKIRKDMPIIICTGFSETLNKEKSVSLGIRQYLEKPVNKKNMAETVRKVLDETKGSTQQ